VAIEEMAKEEEIYEGKLTFTAGIGIRKQIVSLMKNIAFERDVNIEIEEDKGFLTSNFRVKLIGAREDLIEIFSLSKMFAEIVNKTMDKKGGDALH
jgi:hypothetical protein